jgi:hypothetical protein
MRPENLLGENRCRVRDLAPCRPPWSGTGHRPALQSAESGQFFTEPPFSPGATLVDRDKVLSPRPLPWSRDSTGTDIEHRIWQEDDKVKGR